MRFGAGKCRKCVFGGSLQRYPIPSSWIKGVYFYGEGREGGLLLLRGGDSSLFLRRWKGEREKRGKRRGGGP